jgi:hypothetical protein
MEYISISGAVAVENKFNLQLDHIVQTMRSVKIEGEFYINRKPGNFVNMVSITCEGVTNRLEIDLLIVELTALTSIMDKDSSVTIVKPAADDPWHWGVFLRPYA